MNRLDKMIAICEKKARFPIDNLVDYPNNSHGPEVIQAAANYAILAEEFRRQKKNIGSSS